MKKTAWLVSGGILTILILVGVIVSMITSVLTSTQSNDSNGNCNTESEVIDNGNSSSTPTGKAFIESLKEGAIEAWVKEGVLPSALIAQVSVETGYGSSQVFRNANNTGGIKYYSGVNFGAGAKESSEAAPMNEGGTAGNGRYYTYFPSPSASILYQSKMFSKAPYTNYNIRNNKDAKSVCQALQDSPYAQNPTYAGQLYAVIQANDLTSLDKEAFKKSANGGNGGNSSNSNSNTSNNSNGGSKLDNSKRSEIVKLAKSRLGIPYVYGGREWDSGMDCSGLTMLVYKKIGIEIPATSETQSKAVKKISKENAKKGDLVFWGEAGNSHHVAIYIGDNQVIEEPDVGQVCKTSNLYGDYWFGEIGDLGNDSDNSSNDLCEESEDIPDSTGTNSAPTLSVPAEYQGKLTLPAPDNKNYAGNNYPMGQCTWGAYNRMAQIGKPIEWFSGDGGNGGMWGSSAQSAGYTVIKGAPKVGWAVSFPGGVAGSTPPYGHIAVVEYVNKDGSFLVSETNVVNVGSGTRSWRVISKSTGDQAYFIQGKGGK